MGIIISSFPGCGKEYLINNHGNKAKILNALSEFNIEEGYDAFVDNVMNTINDYDIVFVPSTMEVINILNERKIDFDLFYPSKERRGEFIENCVRKKLNHNTIMHFDRDFEKIVDSLDDLNEENCYKHQLKNYGEFIGNNPSIMSYIDSLKNE